MDVSVSCIASSPPLHSAVAVAISASCLAPSSLNPKQRHHISVLCTNATAKHTSKRVTVKTREIVGEEGGYSPERRRQICRPCVPTLRGCWSCCLGFGYYKGKNCKPTLIDFKFSSLIDFQMSSGRSSRGGVRGCTTRGGGRLRIQDLDNPSPLTAPSPPTAPSPLISPSPPTAPSPPIVLSPHSSVHSNAQTDEQPPHLSGRPCGKNPTDGKTWIYPVKKTYV
ncbi:uncharacterized protein G2W53_041840 [Senna tora]|uniref:Uncharacterized protein n=1 Tax=Senna tora TaxID=362788 RepID=A0A834W389_9FABA|nr:uncharacterized protein G2W53_041840 [Senna tora]